MKLLWAVKKEFQENLFLITTAILYSYVKLKWRLEKFGILAGYK